MIDNKSRETYIKNCTYYQLDDLTNINDVAFVNVIIKEASLFVKIDKITIKYKIFVYFFIIKNGYIKGYNWKKSI